MINKIVLFFLCYSSFLLAETPILIIHSYHEEYLWTKYQSDGFKSVMNNDHNIYPLYLTEYIDSKRRGFDEEYEREYLSYIQSKYKNYTPSLIYVTDDDALNFILHNQSKLFPSVPVVYSGVNNKEIKDNFPNMKAVGIFEKKSILPNLKLIQKLFPDEKEVVIVGDGSFTSQMMIQDIKNDLKEYHDLNLLYLVDANLESLLTKLQKVQAKTLILTSIGEFYSSDKQSVHLLKAIQQIQSTGNFFILSLEDSYILNGVAGGYVSNAREHGKEAGGVALKILYNDETTFEQVEEKENNWIFDAQVLKNSTIELPQEISSIAKFINLDKSFYRKNEYYISTILYLMFFIILIGGILFTLYLYRSRKLLAENEKMLLLQAKIFGTVQDSIVVHDFEGRFIYLNDNAWKTRGYTKEEMMKMSIKELDAPHYTHGDPNIMKSRMQEMKEKGFLKVEVEHICKDGTALPVEVFAKVITLNEKNYVLSSIRDIRERREAQKVLESSEKRYKDLVENSTVGVYSSSISGEIIYVNSALVKMFGYDSKEELMETHSLFHYKDPKRREKLLNILSQGKHVNNFEIELVNKYSITLPVMISATLNEDILSGMVIDMSEIKKTREEIEKFSKILQQIDDAVVITDINGVITYVNPAFTKHTGYSHDDVLGRTTKISKSGQHTKDFYKDIWQTILSGNTFRAIFINKKKNGDIYYENKTITPIKNDKKVVTGFVSSGKDVTKETLMNQETERIATIDKLTGIFNRHKFEELFALENERYERYSHPLSLILIDIDHFKVINDTFGHDVGDEVLIHLAKTIQENIRKIDIFARWGGEEFLILSPNSNFNNIHLLAEKLRAAIEKTSFEKVGHITISLGISTFIENDSFAELFKRADNGLYSAKENGRNQIGIG